MKIELVSKRPLWTNVMARAERNVRALLRAANVSKAEVKPATKIVAIVDGAVPKKVAQRVVVRFVTAAVIEEGLTFFIVSHGRKSIEVGMPSVALNRLRGDILQAPRIIVDGNSWWWHAALYQIKEFAGS